MRITRDADLSAQPPSSEPTTVYRETHWSDFFVFLVLVSLAIIWLARSPGQDAWTLSWITSDQRVPILILLAIARYALRIFTASRSKEGWRLRWTRDDLFIRYRSALNNRYPTDTPSVLHLERRDIAWLKAHKEKLIAPDENGNWSWVRKNRWLEIGLRHIDPAPIRQALAAEAKRRDDKGRRVNDYPMQLTQNGTLRVSLRQPDKVVVALELLYPTLPDGQFESGSYESMSQQDRQDHVRSLAQAGSTMDAVKAARQVYGYSLTQAKRVRRTAAYGRIKPRRKPDRRPRKISLALAAHKICWRDPGLGHELIGPKADLPEAPATAKAPCPSAYIHIVSGAFDRVCVRRAPQLPFDTSRSVSTFVVIFSGDSRNSENRFLPFNMSRSTTNVQRSPTISSVVAIGHPDRGSRLWKAAILIHRFAASNLYIASYY